jgi:hypothetical protein
MPILLKNLKNEKLQNEILRQLLKIMKLHRIHKLQKKLKILKLNQRKKTGLTLCWIAFLEPMNDPIKIKKLINERILMQNLMKMTQRNKKSFQSKKKRQMNYVNRLEKFLKFQILNTKIV